MCLPSTFQSALHRGNAFVNQIIIKFFSEKSVVWRGGGIGSHKRDEKQGDFEPLSKKRATLKSFKMEFSLTHLSKFRYTFIKSRLRKRKREKNTSQIAVNEDSL